MLAKQFVKRRGNDSQVGPAVCGVSSTLGSPKSGWSAWRRLLAQHVQAGAQDASLAQRVGQRLLVDQAAARGVDQHRRRLHQRQRLGVDQVPRALVERHVDGHRVGDAQERIERRRSARRALARARRSVGSDRSTRSYVSQPTSRWATSWPMRPMPDDADRGAIQLVDALAVGGVAPASSAHGGVESRARASAPRA